MATDREPPQQSHALDEVHEAERRAARARERAAHVGLSAAKSFERSAKRHDELADTQQDSIRRGMPAPEVNEESSARHREAADEDRHLAQRKRDQSEAGLSPSPEG
ncbi:hypothetical protein AU193_10045 [Mycobacterium sp. GA-1285]|uniref:hypothetical protein n=1 Tax=Mycobacterium sp. GA-1285 TaxID=1772282 RepID=UPI00074A9AA2|nr:hypothetical protein [Mycobacterium sp. GA-1285]KUI22950.1 hypothetical protein AU193_10045 [Mycobacterium sp. GA-1285]